jgi:hypothetical protein
MRCWEVESGTSSRRRRSQRRWWSAEKQSRGGGDGDSRREGDGGILVMVRAPGSRGWGSTGVGFGGTGVRGSDRAVPRSRVGEWRWPKRGWWVRSGSDGDGDGGAPKNFGSLSTSLWNPSVSRVFSIGTVFYIGRPSLVSVILMWPTQKNKYYWCRSSLRGWHLCLLVSAILSQSIPIRMPYK